MTDKTVPLTIWEELKAALLLPDADLLFRLKQLDIPRDRAVWVQHLDDLISGRLPKPQ